MDEEIIRKVKTLAGFAREFLDFNKVFIFGSYAKGKFTGESDIDVAFVVNRLLDNHFELSARLFELVDKIDCRIEPLIIAEENDKSGFFSQILKTGKEIIIN